MSNIIQKEDSVREETLQEAVEAANEQQVAEIVEANTSQEARRQASLMNADERNQFISILTPEAAAEQIAEAPAGMAASMIEGLR